MQIERVRVLSFWDAVAIGVGSTIGPGIFTVIAPLVNISSNLAPSTFLITGFVLLFTVIAHAKLAQSYPETGGFYVFVEKAFGNAAAFIIGWSFCLSAASAAAFVSLGFADYLSALTPLPRIPASLILITFFTILNVIGIEVVANTQKVLVSFVVATILCVIFAGVLNGSFFIPTLPNFNDVQPLITGSFLIYTLFAGFEVVGSVAGEVRNPERTLPTAMILTVLTATALYFLLTSVAIACADVAASSAPIEEVAKILLPPLSPIVILAVIVGSMSVVNGQILLISRVAVSMLDWNAKTAAIAAGTVISALVFLLPSISSLAQVSSLFFILMIVAANLSYVRLFNNYALLPFLLLPVLFTLWADFNTILLSAAWLMLGIAIYSVKY